MDPLPPLPSGAEPIGDAPPPGATPFPLPAGAAPIGAAPTGPIDYGQLAQQHGAIPPPTSTPPKPPSFRESLQHEGFLDSAWHALSGLFMAPLQALPNSAYNQETRRQLQEHQQLMKNGTPEQKREFARDVLLKNIPFASTFYKAFQGNLPGAAGDIAGTFAIPAAMEAAGALPGRRAPSEPPPPGGGVGPEVTLTESGTTPGTIVRPYPEAPVKPGPAPTGSPNPWGTVAKKAGQALVGYKVGKAYDAAVALREALRGTRTPPEAVTPTWETAQPKAPAAGPGPPVTEPFEFDPVSGALRPKPAAPQETPWWQPAQPIPPGRPGPPVGERFEFDPVSGALRPRATPGAAPEVPTTAAATSPYPAGSNSELLESLSRDKQWGGGKPFAKQSPDVQAKLVDLASKLRPAGETLPVTAPTPDWPQATPAAAEPASAFLEYNAPGVEPGPTPTTPATPATALPSTAPAIPVAGELPKVGQTIERRTSSGLWERGTVSEIRKDPITDENYFTVKSPSGYEMVGTPGNWRRPGGGAGAVEPAAPETPPEPSSVGGGESAIDRAELNSRLHAKVARLNLPGSPAGMKSPDFLQRIAPQEFGGTPYEDLNMDQMGQLMDRLDKYVQPSEAKPALDTGEMNRMLHAKVQRVNLPDSPPGKRAPGFLSRVAKEELGTEYKDLNLDQMRDLYNLVDKYVVPHFADGGYLQDLERRAFGRAGALNGLRGYAPGGVVDDDGTIQLGPQPGQFQPRIRLGTQAGQISGPTADPSARYTHAVTGETEPEPVPAQVGPSAKDLEIGLRQAGVNALNNLFKPAESIYGGVTASGRPLSEVATEGMAPDPKDVAVRQGLANRALQFVGGLPVNIPRYAAMTALTGGSGLAPSLLGGFAADTMASSGRGASPTEATEQGLQGAVLGGATHYGLHGLGAAAESARAALPEAIDTAAQVPGVMRDWINQLEYTGGDPERGSISRRSTVPAASPAAPAGDVTAQQVLDAAAEGPGKFGGFASYMERNPTAGEGLFDVSNPQPSLPNRPAIARYDPDPSAGRGRKGPSARVVDAFNNPKVVEGLKYHVQEGAKKLPEDWYANDPLFKVYQQEWGPQAEEKFFQQMGHQAATSTGSAVPDNIRTGAYYNYLHEQGIPFPEPPMKGYGSKYWIAHRDTALDFMNTGNVDPLANPKRASFTENLMGNEDLLTADKHFMRLVGILSEDPRFLKTTAKVSRNGQEVNIKPQELYKQGKLTMADAVNDPQIWEEAPNKNEYQYLENQFRDKVAKPLGYTVADAQGKAWVGGGNLTGLGSPPETWIRLLRQRVQYTADRLNVDPNVVLRKFVRGEIPLLELGGAAAGLGAMGQLQGRPADTSRLQ